MNGCLAAFLLATALSSLSPASARPPAQEPPASQPLFRANVEVVNVLCTVRDRQGRIVADLEADDFEVRENGERRRILHFSRASQEEAPPLSAVLLLDASASVRRELALEQEAASEFLRSLITRPEDAAALLRLGNEVKLIEEFTDNLDHLRSSILSLYPQGRTALLDGVWIASRDLLSMREGRRVIIILSDGKDTASLMSRDEALSAAQNAEAAIFAIGVREAGRTSDFDSLKRLSRASGGIFLDAEVGPERLRAAFEGIRRAISSQYSISYAPAKRSDRVSQRIEIKVKRRGLRCIHRTGYLSEVVEQQRP